MEQYYLGIDVSKGYADFVILNSAKEVAEPNFQLDDTFEGHCRLYTILHIFFANHPKCVMCAAVESTGGYENNWFNSLVGFQATLNIKTARLNPLGVNAHGKANLNRIITDKISALNVAQYLIAHPEKVTYQADDALGASRKQWKFIRMLTKQKTQLFNQLESLLYIANPELLTYCKGDTPMWVLQLIKKYPTASRLSRANAKTVARIPYITADQAKVLIAGAKKSVASATDDTTAQLLKATVEQIIHLKKTIKFQIETMMKQCSVPEVALLKTFDGIGDYSAIGLMLEIQSVKRFSSVKKLAAFFGLHPEFKKSGDGSSGFKMSKKGRKEPRQILFMVTMVAITKNELIQEIYQQHLEKGMEKMAAIGACMHKIIRIIYGMLKHNSPFDPQIDRKNRERKPESSSKISKDKNRRYQDYDSKAPVSRRQHIKRKERKQSHNTTCVKDEIVASAPAPN
jgi:transposase